MQHSLILTTEQKVFLAALLNQKHTQLGELKSKLVTATNTKNALTEEMRFMEDIEVIINKAQPTTIDHVGIAMAKFKEYLEEYFKTTENNDDRKYNYHHAIAYQEILEQYGVDKAEISQITESIRE